MLEALRVEDEKLEEVVKDMHKKKLDSPAKEFLVGTMDINPVFKNCFDSPPHPFYPLIHEAVEVCDTDFQNLLYAEQMPELYLLNGKGRFGIAPSKKETIGAVKELLREKCVEKDIVNAYKDSKDEFKVVRYAFIEYLFPQVRSTENGSSLPAEKGKIVTEFPFAFKLLKQLALIVQERIADELFSNLHRGEFTRFDPICDDNNPNGIEKFIAFWRKFLLSAIEISEALEPLSESVNKATDILLPSSAKKLPKFSVWRFLVGVFQGLCYQPLKKVLSNYIIVIFTMICQMYVEGEYKGVKLVEPKPTKEQIETLLKGKISDFPFAGRMGTESQLEKFQRHIKSVLNAFLDMECNEISVHWVRSQRFAEGSSDFLRGPLITEVGELCVRMQKQYSSNPMLEKYLKDLAALASYTFPAYIAIPVQEIILRKAFEAIKSRVEELAYGFAGLTLEEKQKKAGKPKRDGREGSLIKLISTLKKVDGKMIIPQTEQLLFHRFMNAEHAELAEIVNKYTSDLQKLTEARMEDIEIEIRNEKLKILLEKGKDYRLSGLWKEEAFKYD